MKHNDEIDGQQKETENEDIVCLHLMQHLQFVSEHLLSDLELGTWEQLSNKRNFFRYE
jgi:hypothetical protein